MVGHAGVGSSPPEDAQRFTGRDHPPQRTEVRPPLPGTPRRALPGGTFQRAAEQAGGTQVRHPRLHLREVPAAPQSRLVIHLATFKLSFVFSAIL